MTVPKLKRAIDLYSGVGGWSLGLRMAGIEVVASYERWGTANETNFKNNHHQAQTIDIRALDLTDLPSNIDVVVGSPPCTQFSFSNRGGGGDIDDGLQDIIKFLTVVDYLKPAAWAMENVPRVAGILKAELRPGGRLEAFAHLGMSCRIINMEDFGLPQRRKRCIAGNFDFDLLEKYTAVSKRPTLGDVIGALNKDVIIDPIYELALERGQLRDHDPEDVLNEEEERINRAGKETHPVYNSMVFPDSFARSVRTITATCTRVSRESVVIASPEKPGKYRRLTLRERAVLQGFPITFQFYGLNYSQKLKMIGNAVPPLFSYHVASAILGLKPSKLLKLSDAIKAFDPPTRPPVTTLPDRPGARYPWNRKFRFAIPSLRLKSGVRFDLTNVFANDQAGWRIAFTFGNSKFIHSVDLGAPLFNRLAKRIAGFNDPGIAAELADLRKFLSCVDLVHMQSLWSHSGPGATRAFMLFDRLDEAGNVLIDALMAHDEAARNLVANTIKDQHGDEINNLKGVDKLLRNAPLILAGFLIGSLTNSELPLYEEPMSTKHHRA